MSALSMQGELFAKLSSHPRFSGPLLVHKTLSKAPWEDTQAASNVSMDHGACGPPRPAAWREAEIYSQSS